MALGSHHSVFQAETEVRTHITLMLTPLPQLVTATSHDAPEPPAQYLTLPDISGWHLARPGQALSAAPESTASSSSEAVFHEHRLKNIETEF